LSPTQAQISARQYIQGEREASAKSFDYAKSAREKASTLLRVADTAEQGILEAGTTGNYQGLRRAFEQVGYLFGNDESIKNLRGDKTLESIGPEIVMANKFPGALSNDEMRVLIRSGPSTENTPEENTLLVRNIRAAAKAEMEYADFIDTYRNLSPDGSTRGADAKWFLYKQANPIIVTDGETSRINEDRKDWKTFFNELGNEPGGLTQPTQPMGATDGVPAVGGMYNGSKVVRVTKVR
jgi:hypothetical protein